MFKSVIAKAFAVAFLAVSGASAATVEMSGNQDRVYTLENVSDATLSFSVPMTGGYQNFGGYVKWSTREDGRKHDDGPWGSCLECGYDGGSWSVEYNPWEIVRPRGQVDQGHGTDPSRPGRGNQVDFSGTFSTADLFVDFGDVRDTVYLWVNPTHGSGSVNLTSTGGAASSGTAGAGSSVAPVPLPAGGWLLLSALGAAVALRRRRAR